MRCFAARWWVNGCALLFVACLTFGPVICQADVLADRRQLDDQYRAKLAALADQAQKDGLKPQAERTRDWLPTTPPFSLDLPIVPRSADPAPDATSGAAVLKWHEQFSTLRQAQADALFALAKQAVKEKRLSHAWLWAHAALRENPDHAAARYALGYQSYLGRWVTTFELNKAKSGQVWSDRFGWLPKDELARYEQGERLYRGKWMSVAEEAEFRTRIDRGWELITEHFVIRTNHSLESGAKLASELEKLSQAWHTLFVTFLTDERDMKQWFDGRTAPRKLPPRHEVWYFRNQEEYVEALKDEQPWIANTTGYYDNDKRRAYLYHGLKDYSNIYHEATHQLFAESRPGRSIVGQKANFWIIEGIACYMESLTEVNGLYRLGGLNAVRLSDARIRLLRDEFYVPFEELVAIGMLEFQKRTDIKKLYSQTAGQTYFLLEHNSGAYRDMTVDYLTRIYNSRDTSLTLRELTGHDYPTLDREYREFLLKVQRESKP